MFCTFPEFFERRAIGNDLIVRVVVVYRLVVSIPLAAVAARFSLGLGVPLPAEYQVVMTTRRRDAGGVTSEQFDRTPNHALQRTAGLRRGFNHGVLAQPSLSLGR